MTTRRLGLIVIGALSVVGLLAYALIAHRLTVDDDRSWTGYAFAFGSLGGLLVLLAWSSPRRVWWLSALAAGGAFIWHEHSHIDPRWFYLLQHAGVQALLACLFGRTLLPGRESLITKFAVMVHGTLPPGLYAYTRSVTWAWTLFFVTMALASLILWFFAPPAWWSVLANFVTTPAVAAMFVIEYQIRLRRFPDFQHASFLEGIRAFNRHR